MSCYTVLHPEYVSGDSLDDSVAADECETQAYCIVIEQNDIAACPIVVPTLNSTFDAQTCLYNYIDCGPYCSQMSLNKTSAMTDFDNCNQLEEALNQTW